MKFNFSLFGISGWGIDLDYCDIEWFALETNRDHSVIFESASKYCISDSFVDCGGFWNEQTKMDWLGEFNSDDHYIYYCGQESLRRNGVAIIVNKRVRIQCLDAISKMTE